MARSIKANTMDAVQVLGLQTQEQAIREKWGIASVESTVNYDKLVHTTTAGGEGRDWLLTNIRKVAGGLKSVDGEIRKVTESYVADWYELSALTLSVKSDGLKSLGEAIRPSKLGNLVQLEGAEALFNAVAEALSN